MFGHLGIKAKASLVLILAVVFSLVIAGVLQYLYLYNYHKSNAFEKILLSQSIIKDELNSLSLQNRLIFDDIINDDKVKATVSLISNYESQDNYEPLIFDEVKKKLLEHISNKFILLDDICITVYDSQGRIVTYMLHNNMIGTQKAIGTYVDGGFVLVDPSTNHQYIFRDMPYSINSDFLQNSFAFNKYKIITKIDDGKNVICVSKTLQISNKDNIIGYVKLSRHIDSVNLNKLSAKTSTLLDMEFNDFNFGTLSVPYSKILNKQLVDFGNVFVSKDYYFFDDNKISFYNALSKNDFNTQIKNSILILLLCIIVALIVVLPMMYYLVQKDFINPILQILNGIKLVKKNDYNITLDVKTSDITLNTFAQSFNSMVYAIKQRDKEIKIRNFYDKLIATSSSKFIVDEDFNKQVLNTLRLLKMSLKADSVMLDTFIDESISIKKNYYAGKENFQGIVCENCSCIEKSLDTSIKDILFIKDVSSDERLKECNIYKNQMIKSLVILPIYHKQRRLAILSIEFKEIKNIEDENYSYLLKPIASIFGNVLNQEIQEELNITREQMLFQQSKMAAMGEMIGNIAHQWRQPLSAITTASSGLKLKEEYGMLTKEDIIEFNDAIISHANYLSKTIDDFRNFFKTSKDIEIFDVSKLINNSAKLVESSLKHNYIELIIDILNDSKIEGPFTEAIQAIINILNNAKDAIILNQPQERVIKVIIDKVDNFAVIIVQDSGNGISEDILNKIFEPYFTTKHQSQGTGIGLFMTREILMKHLNGKIEVTNSKFQHNDLECFGALFKILLPLYSNES